MTNHFYVVVGHTFYERFIRFTETSTHKMTKKGFCLTNNTNVFTSVMPVYLKIFRMVSNVRQKTVTRPVVKSGSLQRSLFRSFMTLLVLFS